MDDWAWGLFQEYARDARFSGRERWFPTRQVLRRGGLGLAVRGGGCSGCGRQDLKENGTESELVRLSEGVRTICKRSGFYGREGNYNY